MGIGKNQPRNKGDLPVRTSFAVLAAALLLVTGARAEFKPDVKQYQLDNGLTVLLLENHAAPVATYFTIFKVGARNEHVYNSGLSHFFEHMMFNGAKKYGPKMFDQALESNGGYSNAYTSKNYTAYYEDFSSDILPLVVDLEADRMANLALDSAMIASEKGVVGEERLVSIDNDNEGILWEELWAAAYMCHPYSSPVLGWMESIKHFNRKDCLDYFHTYYAPNNAVLVIVGDFDSAEALKLLENNLGAIPAGPAPQAVPRYEPEQRGARRVEIERDTRQPYFMRGYHVGDKDSPDLPALEIFQFIMTTGESSRMNQALVDKLQLALYQYGGFEWSFDPTLFYFGVGVMPGTDYAEAEKAFDSVLADFIATGPSADELQKAKNSLTANFYKNFKTNNGTAEQLCYYQALYGDYKAMYQFVDRINAVTAEQVKEATAKYFQPNNSTTVVLIPEGGQS